MANGTVLRLRRVVGATTRFASDGLRYVAWQTAASPSVAVLDTVTGKRVTVAVPGGCALGDQGEGGPVPPAGAGRFLLPCGRTSELLDARDGSSMPLPASAGWIGVGSRYLEGDGESCTQTRAEIRYHEPCLALYSLLTGTVVSERPKSQVADLDRPGAPVVCSALRGALVSDRVNASSGTFSYGEGLLARWRIERRVVQVEGCRGHMTTLRATGEALNLDLRAGVLSWDTGHDATAFNESEGSAGGIVSSYSLRTHRRRTWRLPILPVTGGESGLRGAFGYSTHTANTIFWIATERLTGDKSGVIDTSAVYAASTR